MVASGIAPCFINEGATVVLTDVKESKIEKELVSNNDQAIFQQLDVDVTSRCYIRKPMAKCYFKNS